MGLGLPGQNRARRWQRWSLPGSGWARWPRRLLPMGFLDLGSGHLHFYPLRISSSDGGWKVTSTLLSHGPGAGSGTWVSALSLHLLPQCDTGPGQPCGCSEVHLGQARAAARGRKQLPRATCSPWTS